MVSKTALDLIASYLSDSNQMVGINYYLKSQSFICTTVMSVIPQGSIVGPFLSVYLDCGLYDMEETKRK